MSARQRTEELLSEAEARIAEQGYDPATVLAAALIRLGEEWAAEEKGLCPECGRRRVNKGRSACTFCEEARELDLRWKRRWWSEHGTSWRASRASEAATEGAGS